LPFFNTFTFFAENICKIITSAPRHGEGSTSAAALARESLYYKFDPLIAGRQSIMPTQQQRLAQQVKTLSSRQVLKQFKFPFFRVQFSILVQVDFIFPHFVAPLE
jgi:hypothetical protein